MRYVHYRTGNPYVPRSGLAVVVGWLRSGGCRVGAWLQVSLPGVILGDASLCDCVSMCVCMCLGAQTLVSQLLTRSQRWSYEEVHRHPWQTRSSPQMQRLRDGGRQGRHGM